METKIECQRGKFTISHSLAEEQILVIYATLISAVAQCRKWLILTICLKVKWTDRRLIQSNDIEKDSSSTVNLKLVIPFDDNSKARISVLADLWALHS